jgi:hypothetical protein
MERYGTTESKTEHKGTEEKGGMMEGAQDKVRDLAKNVSAEVSGRVEAARDAISELGEKDWNEIVDDASNLIRRYPVPAIVGALFVGYSIGKLFGGGRD